MRDSKQVSEVHVPWRRGFLAALVVGCIVVASGCSSKTWLMPTPTVYTNAAWNPFDEVSPVLQDDEVSVLYLTDRAVEAEVPDAWEYGHRRSRSMAFGEAVVQFGEGLTWEQIVEASRVEKRPKRIEVKVTATREQARFGKTPPRLILTDAQLAMQEAPPVDPAQAVAERAFLEELSARLALTPHKKVFIYVHGFNNTLEDAVKTTAELWHFLGREGVPVCYTWPAGVGLFRGYQYTLGSTEFTVYHFKQALRLIASCPDVEQVNILAHSRGTAATMDTIRELHLETRPVADTQQTLKLGTVILAAADIDLDVVIARDASERIGRATQRSAIYISDRDKALGLSQWLFGGLRLGELDIELFEPEEIEALRSSRRLQLIDARVRKLGSFGHAYFHANPSVSSDVVMLMRYGLAPGAEHGRPLGQAKSGLWTIDDDYPGSDWQPPATMTESAAPGASRAVPAAAPGQPPVETGSDQE